MGRGLVRVSFLHVLVDLLARSWGKFVWFKDSLVSENQHLWIYVVWHVSSLTIDLPYLMLYHANVAFDLLGSLVVFIVNGILLETLELHHAMTMFDQDAFCQFKLL